MKILSFNLGVELGQIVALAVMLILLNLRRKRKSFTQFSKMSNFGLVIAGSLLFLFQMYGYMNAASEDAYIQIVEADIRTATEGTKKEDSVNVTIPAKKGIEYKFLIAKGKVFEYSWKTNGGKLFFDFHGEPTGDKTGYFKSFEESTGNESSGSLTTLFTGTHGWYWENKTSQPVIITLKTKGSYKVLGILK